MAAAAGDSVYMEPNSRVSAKIAYLSQEIHSLHMANSHYWQEEAPTARARSLYQVRQDRLEEIRSELVRLCALPTAGEVVDQVAAPIEARPN
jgi:hypothetical protein